ncbi:MAG: polysaccharide biosynthesis protein PslG [Mycobacterium sp.]|nr:polysaccharide biosynthesis protein PslG [Mycobacterium sp.]
MNKCRGTLLRAIATRAVIAVIPVAMVSVYASGIFISPPRMASYEIAQVAEITDTPNTIGMAESPLYGMTDAQINAQLDQLQSIGVQNIRVFVPWGLIEKTDNTYDWSEIDKVMAAAAARNMGVMAEINATPAFAAPNPGNPGFPPGSDTPNVTKYTDFLAAFTQHLVTVPGSNVQVSYASIVSAYEIWNEPNFIQFSNPISPEDYASLLKAAYGALKGSLLVPGLDPTATVVAGAVGAAQNGPFTMDPVTFVQRMLTALGPDALNYFDALSIHPYGDQIPFSGTCPTCSPGVLTPREQVEAIMAMIGTKKVWLSEYGVSSTDPATYQQQATWIKDLLDTWQNYDQAGPVFLYTGRDYAGTDGGQDMGVWTETGGEKVYVDANGVSHTVSQMIKDWIAAHPLPGNPGNPGPVVNPIAALVQALVAQVQAFVTAVVTAITNFLGGLAGSLSAPAAVVAPLALRSASVVSADTAGLAAEADATAADSKGAQATEKSATEVTATEKTAATETATTETPAAAETAALPAVAATQTATTTAPAATEATVPVKATETATATEPVKTDATGTTGTTATTGPTGTTGTTGTAGTTETASTGTSTGSTTSGSSTEGSKSDESGKSGEVSKSGSSKSGDSTKSSASEGQSKSGKDGDDASGKHTRSNDGTGSGGIKAKPVTVTAGVGAEGGDGSSDSAGGAAS